MSLFNRQNFLDYHPSFFFINLVKHGVTSGDVKTVDYNPTSEDKFFFIPLTSREWIFLKSFQGSLDYPAGFFRKAVDLV